MDMPNKRIDQTIAAGIKRLHSRLRAAWVLGQKLASSADPQSQDPLNPIMLEAARQNSAHFPAFASSDGDDEQVVNSFRRRIMTPARPVAHLALALHVMFLEREIGAVQQIFELIRSAKEWLPDTIKSAEYFRVGSGDLFPARGSQRIKGRNKNYFVPSSESIAVLPYIDTIVTERDFDLLHDMEARLNSHNMG